MQNVNYARDELIELQIKYRSILVKVRDNLKQSCSWACVDEINVFWFKNKKFVEFALNQYFAPYSSYVFTAVTMMDIEDKEHYPFVALGQHHIYDDPLYRYITIMDNAPNNEFNAEMRQHVNDAIEDNIRIIDSCLGIILILPVRFFAHESGELARKASSQAFFSMFGENVNQEMYRECYDTIESVETGLISHVKSSIFFNSYDEIKLPFKTRFLNYKQNTTLPLSEDMDDSQIFQFAMWGYFYQAFEILLMCAENRIIPYIRFDAAFHYMYMLSKNLGDDNELVDIVYKGIIAHVLHNNFDKERFAQLSFRDYYKAMNDANYDTRLFESLAKQGINKLTPSIKSIVETSDALLESILFK